MIEEDVANCCAELIMIAFTEGCKHLSKIDIEISIHISRVRIHVEQVLRRVKEFAILRDIPSA